MTTPEDTTYPDDLPFGADHDARMAVARRAAQWHLGDESWADVFVEAYLRPTAAAAELYADGADDGAC